MPDGEKAMRLSMQALRKVDADPYSPWAHCLLMFTVILIPIFILPYPFEHFKRAFTYPGSRIG